MVDKNPGQLRSEEGKKKRKNSNNLNALPAIHKLLKSLTKLIFYRLLDYND
jgi:hypothetical protein